MIEALIERLEAGERSLELDQAISVVFGFKGSAACPPYSHQSPLMRMATISRLRRIEIRQARRDSFQFAYRSGRTLPGLIPNRGAALRIASAA